MMFWDKAKKIWRKLSLQEIFANIVVKKAGGIKVTEMWKRSLNRFTGCEIAKCPKLGECSTNPFFDGCPLNLTAFNAFNPPEHRAQGVNTVLNSVFDKIADMTTNTSNSMSLYCSYIAAGTGTAPTVGSWVDLQIEGYRIALTAGLRPSTGTSNFYWYIPPGSGTGTWTEWALTCDGATGTAGSGKSFNRWLDTVDKQPADSLTGQYQIAISNP